MRLQVLNRHVTHRVERLGIIMYGHNVCDTVLCQLCRVARVAEIPKIQTAENLYTYTRKQLLSQPLSLSNWDRFVKKIGL